jgi:hypothetical protein
MTVVNLKNVVRKKMYVNVSSTTVCPHYLAVTCIYVIYKCLSWAVISARSGQAKPKKPSQAIDGKLLRVLTHVTVEITQSALRREQGWTHSLRYCKHLATQECME